LAERLVTAFILGNGGTSSFPKAEFMDFGPVADECIRQMEWQHERWYKACGEAFGACPEVEVTLAPDDWKVPE
jgi:hypothetical protein